MQRFLLRLVLNLFALAALLTAGFWWARASVGQVSELQRIDEALQRVKKAWNRSSERRLGEMRRNFFEAHTPSNEARYKAARTLHHSTLMLLATYDSLRLFLVLETNGADALGRSINLRAEGNAFSALTTVAGRQRMARLQKRLFEYKRLTSVYVPRVVSYQFANVELGSAPVDGNIPSSFFPDSWWAQIRQLVGLPLSALLAEICRQQIIVLTMEHKALNSIRGDLGGDDYINSLSLAVNFPSRTVLTTEKIRAQVWFSCDGPFVSTIDSLGSISAKKGQEISSVVHYNSSELTFVAQIPKTGCDEWGRSFQDWEASQFASIDGVDTTFTYRQPYIVTRPRFEITVNGQRQVLYRHCRNRVRVQHQAPPPTGTPLKAWLGVTGGRLLPPVTPAPPNEADVLADATQVLVHGLDPVSHARWHTETFGTVAPPAPTLRLWAGDSAVSLRRGVTPTTPTLRVQAEADADFGESCPADARYEVSGTVELVRRGQAVGAPRRFVATCDLRPLGRAARAGDWYVVRVTRVERRNAVGERWPEERAYPPFVVPVY